MGQTEIYGLFCEFVGPPGRKCWLPFSVKDMSVGIRKPCSTKFFMFNFLKTACNQRYPPNIENSSAQNTRLILYFIIVSMS